MTRRATLAALSALALPLARAAAKLPANKNVKWALGSNLWNYFPRVPFTDILDVMRDTGFIGIRVTQFPQILTTYNITQAEMEREVTRRGLHVITISFNGAAHDPARRAEVLDNAKRAMGFLKGFGADKLVVFSPNRAQATGDAAFRTACECYNELGALAKDMGFRAGLHNHMGQMVQNAAELDRCMAMTDPKLFWLRARYRASSFGGDRRGEDARQIQRPSDDGGLQRRSADVKPDKLQRQHLRSGRWRSGFSRLPPRFEIDELQGLAMRRSGHRAPGPACQLRALRGLRSGQAGTDLCVTYRVELSWEPPPWSTPPSSAADIPHHRPARARLEA